MAAKRNEVYDFDMPIGLSVRNQESIAIFNRLDKILKEIELLDSHAVKPLLFINQTQMASGLDDFEYFDMFFQHIVFVRGVLNRLSQTKANTFFFMSENTTGTSFEVAICCRYSILLNPRLSLGFSTQDQSFVPLLGAFETSKFDFFYQKSIETLPVFAVGQSQQEVFCDLFSIIRAYGFDASQVKDNLLADDSDFYHFTDEKDLKNRLKEFESRPKSSGVSDEYAEFWQKLWGFVRKLRKSSDLSKQMAFLSVEARLKYFANDLVLSPSVTEQGLAKVREKRLEVLIRAPDLRPYCAVVVNGLLNGSKVCLEFTQFERIESELNSVSYLVRKQQLPDSTLKNLSWFLRDPQKGFEVANWSLSMDVDQGDLVKFSNQQTEFEAVRLGQASPLDVLWEVHYEAYAKLPDLIKNEASFGNFVCSAYLPGTLVPVSLWTRSLLLEEMILVATATKITIYQLLAKFEKCGLHFLANEAEWERFLRNRFATWPVEDTDSKFFDRFGPSTNIWEMTSLRSTPKIAGGLSLDDSLIERRRLRPADVLIQEHFFGFFQVLANVLCDLDIGLNQKGAQKLVAASFGFVFDKPSRMKLQEWESQRKRVEYLMHTYWPKLENALSTNE